MSEELFRPIPELPAFKEDEFDFKIINGQPEVMVNRAGLERMIVNAPCGEAEARRRLRAIGAYPTGE